MGKTLNYSPRAALTRHHRLGLKTTEMYCFRDLQARSLNQGVSRTMLPLKGGGDPSLPLAASGGCPSQRFAAG